MSAKKLSAEEDIDKQYREYKEQFDRWKENNKHAIGSEAYNNYVLQFQTWEREVEKRKTAARRGQDQNRLPESNEEAAARVYAAQQEYMRMHQKGIQDDMRNRLAPKRVSGLTNSPHTPSNRDVQSAISSLTSAITNAMKSGSGGRSPADALKPVAQSQSAATISAGPVMASQAPIVAAQPAPEPVKPPQLWWAAKPAYGPQFQEGLFKIFGNLAAPTTTKIPLTGENYNPGWLVQREMTVQNLKFFDQSMEVAMAPAFEDTVLPPPPKMMKILDVPLSFNVPPPFVPPNVAPPAMMVNQPPPQSQMAAVFNPRVPPPNFDPRVPPPPLPNSMHGGGPLPNSMQGVPLPNSFQGGALPNSLPGGALPVPMQGGQLPIPMQGGGMKRNLSFPGHQPMPIHG